MHLSSLNDDIFYTLFFHPHLFCGISRYRSDFLETFRLEDLKELLAAATAEGTRIKAADLIREMEEAELEESKARRMKK